MGRVCQGFLQCLLKFVNFFLVLVAIAMMVYSGWMLTQWNSDHAPVGPPVSPPPLPGDSIQLGRATWMIDPSIPLYETNLPAPWFIYAFFGVGAIVLLISLTGHIAAETASGCCLCCYTFCLVILLLVQAALAGVIFFDKDWETIIPDDPTGEFHRAEHFIKHNLNICKWVAVGVVSVEAVSLFLAIVLRSVAIGAQRDYTSDDDVPVRTARQPLLNRQPTNATPSAPAESRPPPRTDAWSTRMREKYGLDTSEFTYNPVDSQRTQQQGTAPPEDKKGCVIM